MKTACSVAVNGSSYSVLFGPAKPKDRLVFHRNTWKATTLHLPSGFSFAMEHQKFFLYSGFSKTSTRLSLLPISTCSAVQTELLSLLFRWFPTIPTSLYRNKITFAPKKSCSAWYGTIKIKIVRNGRTVKIHNCPSAKLISPLFGMSDVLFIFKLR